MSNESLQPLLYLLTEDDNDDLFFEACVEQITGFSFHQVNPRRIRKGGGIGQVRKVLPAFLKTLKAVRHQPAFFVIALDNDRAPEHPQHQQLPGIAKQDLRKQCRYCEVLRMLHDHWGHDKGQWPA